MDKIGSISSFTGQTEQTQFTKEQAQVGKSQSGSASSEASSTSQANDKSQDKVDIGDEASAPEKNSEKSNAVAIALQMMNDKSESNKKQFEIGKKTYDHVLDTTIDANKSQQE